MYFSFFVITLFVSYFIYHGFFYVSIFRFYTLKKSHPQPKYTKIEDKIFLSSFPFLFKVFMHLMIISILFIIGYIFSFRLEEFHIMDSSISRWASNYTFLITLGVLWLISLILMLLYYTFFGSYMTDLGVLQWHDNGIREYIFNIPMIKRIYKVIGFMLAGYFILFFVQYHFYLNKINPYVAVDKYRHFLPTSYDRLAQEGTRRLNARYQGRYYDDVFNEISQDWSSVLIEQGEEIHTIQGLVINNLKYQIIVSGLGVLLSPNIFGGHTYCIVHLNFLEDGIFSEAETYCYKEVTFSITP